METLQAKPNITHAREEDFYIVFMAYRSKTFTGCKVTPLPDRSGKHYTGQGRTGYYEDISPNDKLSMAYVITPQTTRTITHGKSLDMRNAVDEADWKWIQKHPYVALTKEAGNTNRDAVVYVENRQLDAEERLKKTEKVDRARFTVRHDVSPQTLYSLAGALDMPQPQSASYNTVLDYVLNCANEPKQAELILTLLGQGENVDAKRDAMALFFNLKRNNVIDKYAGGIFRWNGENGVIIGTTQENAFEFLMDPKNTQTVEGMKGQLAIKLGN